MVSSRARRLAWAWLLALVCLVSIHLERVECDESCGRSEETFSPVELISKKRDGGELSREEIDSFIRGYHSGLIPDYQMSSMLMATYIRGMTANETAHLTGAITSTGETLDLSKFGQTVDKHSTGGVGDKVSLALAPLVASLGLTVPMMSGRGLGHTGGTLDKLESIPGLRTNLTTQEFMIQLGDIGVAITGPTDTVAPVDRRIYALRDVTGTTSSLPLIVSSIMSKKLAEGASALLLDVKTGSGAFLKRLDDSKRLAELMVAAGEAAGRKTIALMSSNDEPLGYAVGNRAELVEAARVLQGEGPTDVKELVRVQCALMLQLSGRASFKGALADCDENLANGKGLATLEKLIIAQGGDIQGFRGIMREQPSTSKHVITVKSTRGGHVAGIDSDAIGWSCVALGGGRSKADSPIDHNAAIMLTAKVGDAIEEGGTLAVVYTDVDDHAATIERILRAFHVGEKREGDRRPPLIRGVVGHGWYKDWADYVTEDTHAYT